jgi:hypothetical protein
MQIKPKQYVVFRKGGRMKILNVGLYWANKLKYSVFTDKVESNCHFPMMSLKCKKWLNCHEEFIIKIIINCNNSFFKDSENRFFKGNGKWERQVDKKETILARI